MKNVKFGAIKFKSITAAAKAAQKKRPDLKFMTIYMRLRAGKSVGSALQKPPRRYVKKTMVETAAVAV